MSKNFYKAVESNTKFQACRADYAYEHPEYQADRFYNFSPDGSDIKVSTTDARLPDRKKTHFNTFFGGPTHMMPSIDYIASEADDPRKMKLYQAKARCYSKAKLMGYKYFGLQDGGICMAGNEALGDRLPVEECDGKKGGKFTTSVYEIKNLEFADEWQDTMDDHEFVKKYEYGTPVIGDRMLPPINKSEWFELTPTQKYLPMYFTPQNPIKGINIVGSPGSGKTCAMLNIMGNFMSGSREDRDPDKWRIFWLTRKSLVSIPDRDMFGGICLTKLRAMIDSADPLTTSTGEIRAGRLTDDQIRQRLREANPNISESVEITQEIRDQMNRDDKIAAIRSRDANIRILLANQFGIELKKSNILGYDDFVKLLLRATRADADAYAAHTRHEDFGFKTLFIMDEAQNWTSLELPFNERERLDQKFSGGFEVSGKHFYDKSDVYGASIQSGELEGRDILGAMLQRSYELSGDSSAKIVLATGTLDNLFWMLNIMIPKERDRVSMDVLEYYDGFSMSLREPMMEKLARASYGRISHLDVSEIPDQFALKLFESVHTCTMQEFHREILKKQLAAHPNDTDEVYKSLMVFAQTTGPVYSHAQIEQYESNLEMAKNWNNQSREQQVQYYNINIEAARKAFGLEPTAKDIAQYNQKLAAFMKYREQVSKFVEKQRLFLLHAQFKQDVEKPVGPALKPPIMPEKLRAATKNNQLVSFQQWEDPEFAPGIIPSHVRSTYQELLAEYKQTRIPNAIIGPDSYPMSLLQYWMSVNPATADRRSKYQQLERMFHEYQAKLAAYRKDHENREKWALVAKASKHAELGKQPELPVQLKGFSLDDITPLSINDWVARTRFVKEPRSHFPFLIRDPATQKQRLKTLEEFVSVAPVKPVWDDTPADANFSFLVWSKKFDPVRARELLKYYAPVVYNCIMNIIRIEKEALETRGYGYKHMVFTFSSASTKFPNAGSRCVLSAFAAFPELFQIMVQYSETTTTNKLGVKKRVRSISNAPTDKWGVTCLSSGKIPAENIPGNEDSYPQVLDFDVGALVDTATEAWSAPDNKFGARIKVMVADEKYAEGVDITETEFQHFLGASKSARKLYQAMSRNTRQRKSQDLDFFQGVGAFVRAYFYELWDPIENNTVYDQWLANTPYSEKLANDLNDTINALVPQLSIDYALTRHLREFRPVHSGHIAQIDRRVGYLVRMRVLLRGELGETHLIVDPDSVVNHVWKRGDSCYALSRSELGVIKSVKKDKAIVLFRDLEEQVGTMDIRIPVDTKIEFHIPNGVELSKKVMNIGDYNGIHTSVVVDKQLEAIHLPDLKLGTATELTFLSDPKYFLLGIFGLVTLLDESNTSADLHIMLPSPTQKYYTEPSILAYGMQWGCVSAERELQYNSETLAQFLQPTTGISIMVLSLSNIFCDFPDARQLVNWLIYCPEQKSIERFDPRGRVLHTYDTIALDARLYELFYSLRPDVNYMCVSQTSAETSFLQEDTGLTHASITSLIYMHARVLHMANSSTPITPLPFQESLFAHLNKMSSRKIGRYAAGYTKKVLAIKSRILKSSNYQPDMPFWTNAVIQLEATLQKIRGTRKSKLDNMDDLAHQVFRAFD